MALPQQKGEIQSHTSLMGAFLYNNFRLEFLNTLESLA